MCVRSPGYSHHRLTIIHNTLDWGVSWNLSSNTRQTICLLPFTSCLSENTYCACGHSSVLVESQFSAFLRGTIRSDRGVTTYPCLGVFLLCHHKPSFLSCLSSICGLLTLLPAGLESFLFRKSLPKPISWSVPPTFSSSRFVFTSRSLLSLELMSVQGGRKWSS